MSEKHLLFYITKKFTLLKECSPNHVFAIVNMNNFTWCNIIQQIKKLSPNTGKLSYGPTIVLSSMSSQYYFLVSLIIHNRL